MAAAGRPLPRVSVATLRSDWLAVMALRSDLLSLFGDLDVGGMWRLVATQHHGSSAHPPSRPMRPTSTLVSD
jgi:hypothetical protein